MNLNSVTLFLKSHKYTLTGAAMLTISFLALVIETLFVIGDDFITMEGAMLTGIFVSLTGLIFLVVLSTFILAMGIVKDQNIRDMYDPI